MGQDSLYRECCILHPELSASTTKELWTRAEQASRRVAKLPEAPGPSAEDGVRLSAVELSKVR